MPEGTDWDSRSLLKGLKLERKVEEPSKDSEVSGVGIERGTCPKLANEATEEDTL